MWFLVFLLVALRSNGDRGLSNIQLDQGLGSGAVLLAWCGSLNRVRSSLCRALLPTTRRLIPLAGTIAVATAIGWLVAGLKL